jgi:hypothetical protein
MSNKITVFVRTLNEKTYNFQVDPRADKVSDLTKQICEKLGYEQNQARLVYAGKQLDQENNDLLLHEFGIQNNSTLFLILRLKGGI